MYHFIKSLYRYATSKEGLDNAGKTTLLNQIKALFQTQVNDSTENQPNPDAGNTVPTIGQNVATITLPDMYVKIWDIGGQMTMRRIWQSYYSSCHAIIFVVDSSDVGEDADLSRLESRRPSIASSIRTRNLSLTTSVASASASAAADGDDGDAMDRKSQDNASINLNGINRLTTIEARGSFGRLDECAAVLESVLQNSETAGVPILVLANKQDREDSVEVVRIKEGFVRKVFEGQQGEHIRDSRVLPVSALMGTGVREAVEWVRTRMQWNKELRPPVMR
ncbi:ADP-ribosylation factor protein 3 [Ascosphaera aggregata]|nr:ADP-ribosylation factor protein 3 [Ascosphaera aggregata]